MDGVLELLEQLRRKEHEASLLTTCSRAAPATRQPIQIPCNQESPEEAKAREQQIKRLTDKVGWMEEIQDNKRLAILNDIQNKITQSTRELNDLEEAISLQHRVVELRIEIDKETDGRETAYVAARKSFDSALLAAIKLTESTFGQKTKKSKNEAILSHLETQANIYEGVKARRSLLETSVSNYDRASKVLEEARNAGLQEVLEEEVQYWAA